MSDPKTDNKLGWLDRIVDVHFESPIGIFYAVGLNASSPIEQTSLNIVNMNGTGTLPTHVFLDYLTPFPFVGVPSGPEVFHENPAPKTYTAWAGPTFDQGIYFPGPGRLNSLDRYVAFTLDRYAGHAATLEFDCVRVSGSGQFDCFLTVAKSLKGFVRDSFNKSLNIITSKKTNICFPGSINTDDPEMGNQGFFQGITGSAHCKIDLKTLVSTVQAFP